MVELETLVRVAIRDAVNRPSRKPFQWGGLQGYEQLEKIAAVLNTVPAAEPETAYLRALGHRVQRVVDTYRVNAADVRAAHGWLRRLAHGLRYPAAAYADGEEAVSSAQVEQEVAALLAEFQPDRKRQPAQTALYDAWERAWRTSGSEWLPCYDIPGLPPDNLALEAVFGNLRRHQRRVSGRKSTRKLRDFGQYQVLFLAASEAELLEQLRHVPIAVYQEHRQRLAAAEAPRRFLHRLHRDALSTMRHLVDQHQHRRVELAADRAPA